MAHRYRVYPSRNQAQLCRRHCRDTRFVKNLALEQFSLYDRRWGPTPGPAERMRQLADARKETWLGQGSSAVQQQALRDFDRALANWREGRARRPTWWKRGIHESFTVRDARVRRLDRRWASVLVPKTGWVRFRLSRPLPLPLEYGMARVTLDRAGRWHVSFTAPQPTMLRSVSERKVGIDLGVVATVTTSDGEGLHVSALTPGESQRLRRLERRNARQRQGSNRRDRTKRSIARLHARQGDRRKDFVEKVSTRLVRENDLIALEDLKVKSMVRSARGTVEQPGVNVRQKAGLNRSIHEQGWAMLRQRIEDKAATCGVHVVAVPPAYTSQTCNACRHIEPENRESQAIFRCRACGHEANADINAANNILAAGLAVTARGGTARRDGPREARTLAVAA
jgi:IS605 OrfB family transposase